MAMSCASRIGKLPGRPGEVSFDRAFMSRLAELTGEVAVARATKLKRTRSQRLSLEDVLGLSS